MKAKIIHVQGNDLKLEIPLIQRSVVTVNSLPEQEDSDFVPAGTIKVRVKRGFHSYDLDAEVNGNVIVVSGLDRLPIGKYALSIKYMDDAGYRLRYYNPNALEVVGNTEEGGVYRSGEYNSEAHFLHVINRVSAIVITDDKVIINAGGGFSGEITEDAVILRAIYGTSHLYLTDSKAIIQI